MEQKIEVSVVCNTYNHEKYIADAIESFLMQKTNFGFEVLIHDDASTDNTAAIIREYEKKFPDIIKPIYQKENQYSKGMPITGRYQIPRAKGKYIAFCEGDDYWTDPLKLQKQYDAMEQHLELDVCAHGYMRVDPDSKEVIRYRMLKKRNCIIPIEEVILGEGELVATESLFFRKQMYDEILPFMNYFSYDYTWQIQGALRGGMLYLSEYMSAYRFMVPNSYSYKESLDKDWANYLLSKKYKMLQLLDQDTQYKYHDVIQARLLLYEIDSRNSIGVNRDALRKYKRGFYKLPHTDKIKVIIKTYSPIAIRIKRKIFVEREEKIRKKIRKDVLKNG